MESRKCKRKLKNGIWHLEIKKNGIWNLDKSRGVLKKSKKFQVQDFQKLLYSRYFRSPEKWRKKFQVQDFQKLLYSRYFRSPEKWRKKFQVQDFQKLLYSRYFRIDWETDRQTDSSDRQLIHFSVALSKAKLLLPKEALNKIKNKLQIILLFK